MSYAQLELEVVRWAEARQIIKHSTPLAQARKTLEEAGELLEAAAKLDLLIAAKESDDQVILNMVQNFKAEYRDALADVLITLIVGAACADVDLMQCLEEGYSAIKDRKGTLRADGVFVKESDER